MAQHAYATPMRSSPLSSARERVISGGIVRFPVRRRKPLHGLLRRCLIGLDLFIGATAVVGGVAVVPTLPSSWLVGTPFASYLLPAIGLIAIGAIALLAAGLLLRDHPWGPPLSIAAGAAIAMFEIVEVVTLSLGDWLGLLGIQRGHRMLAIDEGLHPALWLQPLYLLVGVVVVSLGWRLLHWHRDALATRMPRRRARAGDRRR